MIGDAVEPQQQVNLLEALIAAGVAAAVGRRLERRIGPVRQRTERLGGHLDEHVVVDAARGRDNHALGAVVLGHVVDEDIAREAPDTVRRPQDRSAERLIGVGGLLEQVEDQVVGGVVDLGDLLNHDVAFALELVVGHRRVLHDIGEDVDRQRHVPLEHAGDVRRLLARGVRVEVSAHRFDLFDDGERGAPLGALEGHVFEEVRDAVEPGALAARAGIDPHPHRSSLEPRHVDADDPEAAC